MEAYKLLIKIIIFSGGCYLGYLLDEWLIELILKEVPASAEEWVGLITIGLWVLVAGFSGAGIITLASLVTKFGVALLFKKPEEKQTFTKGQPKSRFQERLEKMAQKHNKN